MSSITQAMANPNAPPQARAIARTLETRNLVKIYGTHRVVNDVSLTLSQGEIVGLLGPNGAGKTTTFNMVVGIVKPNAGSILLEGRDIAPLPLYQRARAGVGYLTQETSVFRKMTVRQNVLSILETTGASRAEQMERLERILGELAIEHLSERHAYNLSGGERRRVEIARSLAIEPNFMLLDEPFSGVDPKSVEELQEIIYQMRDRGLGILITDHSVRETLSVTDRAYIIHEGTIRAHGSADELVNNPEVRKFYLGERFYMDMSQRPPDKK